MGEILPQPLPLVQTSVGLRPKVLQRDSCFHFRLQVLLAALSTCWALPFRPAKVPLGTSCRRLIEHEGCRFCHHKLSTSLLSCLTSSPRPGLPVQESGRKATVHVNATTCTLTDTGVPADHQTGTCLATRAIETKTQLMGALHEASRSQSPKELGCHPRLANRL